MFAHMLMFLSRAKTGCIAATRPRAPFLDCRGNKWKLPPPSYIDSYLITKQSNPFTLERRSGMSAHAGASRMQHGPVNRLASETSPYLLQHAHNPVEWFAWGQEAFEAARQKNVPIFLSIGYSTCHWCHVMAEESFEAEDVAVLLNKHFIAVKVDREERPDVDKVYMTYVQALHGGGGWPLSVFLTPQLDPFFGATYFPKEDANGRPGFKTVLKRIADVWQRQREDILSSSAETMRQLGELITTGHEECAISESDFDKAINSCAASLASRFDSRNGGFSSAPKFPRPSEMALLLTQYVRRVGSSGSGGSQAEEEARKLLHMVRFTLQRMAQGGIYDHIGGGFARYSTDSVWLVPHFEKMLYDQAQLVQVYLDAFTITKSPDLAVTARGTLDYMIRNLSLTNSSDSSAFCAAEDADSVDPSDGRKKEGFFYVWTSAEVDHVLGDRVGGVFKVYYGIKPEGNCAQSDPHGQFVGKNVLHVAQRDEDRNDDKELEDVLAEAREKMFAARQSRSPPPLRDDKIIVAWNGMALSALARAGRVLMHDDSGYGLSFPVQGREAKEYLKWAIGLASFLQNHVWDAENEELFRIFSLKLNKAHVKAFSDDYALLIGGLLDLYAATGNVKILAWAEDLQRVMDDKFWDHEKGGYFQSSLVKDDDSVKLKIKEDYDGAEPSANSIAVSNLWRLAGLSGTERRRMLIDRAKACAVAFSGRLSEGALAMPQMCCSLSLLESRGRQVVIVGRRGLEDTESLINAAFSVFSPDKIIIHLDLNDDEEMRYWRNRSPEVVAIAEASGMVPTDRATAFVCQNFTCKAPTCDPDVLAATLSVPLPTRL